MKIIPVSQGTQVWLDLRAKHNTASEAPAIMGASKYMSRSDLMKQKATGITPDVDGAKQALFNRGHAAEEGARAILERMIDEDLYPVTCVCEKTNLLASLDGLNMSGTIAFECKLWNERLVEQVRAGDLDPHYYWQLEQELLVTGAEKVIFVTSDGTEDKFVSMDYRAVPGRAEQLVAAWAQFDADRELYIPPAAAPVAIGRVPETLPALRIEVTGMVTASNLAEYKTQAMAVLGSINRELSTDAQFADAETTIKWCTDAESRLAAAKQHALSQTASIDELFRTIDDISAEARRVRLELDKLVKARKEEVRGELVAGGIAALRDHVEALNARLGKPLMPAIAADFAGSIKGRRTVESLRDAVNTELARAKIEASAVADRIQSNLALLQQHQALAFLFADIEKIVLKQTDDFAMLVKGRIDFHQAAEAAKEEATRARIRAEEQAKAERAAKELIEREAAVAKRLADQAALEAKEKQEQADAEEKTNAAIAETNLTPAQASIESAAIETVASTNSVVVPMNRPAITPDLAATIRLGQINELLAPYLQLSGANLAALGFAAVGRDKAAVLYRADDLPLMLAGLIDKLQAVQAKAAA